MPVYQARPASQRVMTFGMVVALHVLVIALLASQSATVRHGLPRILQAVRVVAARPPPPPPLQWPLPTAALPMPDLAALPPPDIEVNQPPSSQPLRTAVRTAPAPLPVSHFAAATDGAGLAVEAATTAGGGARGRGSLADFQAAVNRAVLAHKVQPQLAWDRRNTCVVNYTVSIASDGSLAGVSIDACAIPEINAAAEAAVRQAAPFPPPPDLGAARTTVHGTLIFHP